MSPLLASTSDHPLATEGAGGHHVPSTKGHTTDEDEDEEDLLSMLRGNRNSGKGKQSLKRGRHLLEDDDEVEKDLETGPFKGVDGMSVLFDHVILPLISLTNVYRKQVKAQEAVIKAKENEVYEALEILELSGINHRNRRRATEPYQKGAAETKVQSVTARLFATGCHSQFPVHYLPYTILPVLFRISNFWSDRNCMDLKNFLGKRRQRICARL